MRWYIPSWHGDFRFEPDAANPAVTILTVHKPTTGELDVLRAFEAKARKKGWYASDKPLVPADGGDAVHTVHLAGPIRKIAPALVKKYRPGKAVLTAIVSKDGAVSVVDGGGDEHALELAVTRVQEPEKVVTVKRPTPCCPTCVAKPYSPADEVLREFLDPQQLADWDRHHAIVVRGGLTGFPYLLAHRDTPLAERIGKVCYCLHTGCVVHWHASDLPAEEEVLAGKLILEHREPWLRNQATMLSYRARGHAAAMVFSNPFGDGGDGVESAALTRAVPFLAPLVAALKYKR